MIAGTFLLPPYLTLPCLALPCFDFPTPVRTVKPNPSGSPDKGDVSNHPVRNRSISTSFLCAPSPSRISPVSLFSTFSMHRGFVLHPSCLLSSIPILYPSCLRPVSILSQSVLLAVSVLFPIFLRPVSLLLPFHIFALSRSYLPPASLLNIPSVYPSCLLPVSFLSPSCLLLLYCLLPVSFL